MLFRVLQIAVPFIWLGLVLGLAFIEAPLKFQAPGITLPLGLGIGRLVFSVLNKIEIILALVLIFSVIRLRPSGKFAVWAVAVIAALLVLETAWLLPLLDARAEQVIAGAAAPYSYTHVVYIVFDSVKVILLFALGVSMAKQHLRTEL
jgi:hypothetical protein